MSKTTITVYDLEKNGFNFGLQDYPIFEEAYRQVLNRTILDYYRWYEIGYDNPMKWKERINAKLNRIIQSTKHFYKNVKFVMYLKINALQSFLIVFLDCKSYYLIDISLYLIIVVNPSKISIK